MIALALWLLGSWWGFVVPGVLCAVAFEYRRNHHVAWALVVAAVAWATAMGVYRAGAEACEARNREIRAAVNAIDKELTEDFRAKLELQRKDNDERIKDYLASIPDDCRATRRDVDTIHGILRGTAR